MKHGFAKKPIGQTALRPVDRIAIAVANGRVELWSFNFFGAHFTSLLSMATRAAPAAAKLLADERDTTAQFVFGMCLLEGNGVDVDEMQACEYFKLSGDRGNSDGQFSYGRCLEHGQGVLVDLREAALYNKLSADQGNSFGQYEYGRCLENGIGFSIDLIEAARYSKLSADHGHSFGRQCYRRLGLLFNRSI
jgi:TPR repeat protein